VICHEIAVDVVAFNCHAAFSGGGKVMSSDVISDIVELMKCFLFRPEWRWLKLQDVS
jgi:hypothetical protein